MALVKKIVVVLSVSLVLSTSASYAAMTDPLIEGAKKCTRHLPRYEREYGIPKHLLSAIASTESGRFHKGLNISIPWPWTINAQGKGYYFKTKAEAIAKAKKLRRRGIKSMDVGCMQVNLHYHAKAFSSLEQAFEPRHNIAYAASFLRKLYEDSKSWKEASAGYHSKTPSRGKRYVGGVYDRWYDIVAKLRAAKLASVVKKEPVGDAVKPVRLYAKSGKPLDGAPVKAQKIAKKAPKQVKRAIKKIVVLPEQRGSKTAAHKTPRMNNIKVTRQEDKRENGIIVVRPNIKVVDEPAIRVTSNNSAKPKIVTVAQIKPVSSAKVINVNKTKNTKIAPRSGPRFIFEN